MISFSGTLDVKTYAKAVRKMSKTPMYVGGPLLMVAVAVGAARPDLWLFSLIVGLFGVSMFFAPGRAARRIFATSAMIGAPHRYTADDDRLTIDTPYSSSNFPWRVFYTYRLDDDVILLYLSAAQSLVLPRNFFASGDEWEAFRTLLRAHVRQPRIHITGV